MKGKIFILAILLIPAFTLQAGVRIGAKAGINLSKSALTGYSFKADNLTGYQIGPIIEISGTSGFGLDIAALYSQHGLKSKESEISLEQTVKTLDVPVNLKLKLPITKPLGCYFTAGTYVSFKLDEDICYNNIKMQWKTKKFGVGLNFGAGVELFRHLQVGVNYQLALNDDYSNFTIDELKGLKAKTRIWSLTAAYLF